MIRLLAPLAFVSLGLAAEQAQSQEAGSFVQAPFASVEQPQQFFYPQPQSFAGAAQQYVQYQPQAQQQTFYYPQHPQQQQAAYYPFQPFQQLQYAPAPVQQPAFVMSPKLTIPTGLLRKYVNSSSDEPSVFAFSYNPDTGLKVATVNGKKVFAYKQRFPGAPKEDVEIVENGDVKTSGNPTVVASTSENGDGEKTKNVWFDDKDDPMVKIEKEPVGAVATTTVDPNLPVVSQDGDETTTAAPAAVTTTEAATTAAAAEIAAGGVTVTPVPAAVAALAADASTTVAAVPAATGVAAVTTTAVPVVPTTTPVPGQAFFATQNPLYMSNVAAFSAQYPQYFTTRFAPKAFPAQYAAVAPQAAAQFAAAAPSTITPSVAPANYQVTPGPIFAGSGLSQVHPVYAQSAISTTPLPQVAAQYVARPVAVGVAQPRPLYMPVPQPTPVPVAQQQYLQPTAVPVAPQQQQYLSTPQPVPQQYLQPVQQPQIQQPQFVQQPQQQQQYLQPTSTPQIVRFQPAPQYMQSTTAQPQYYAQAQTAPVPLPQQQTQYAQHAPPPATPAYHGVQRPAPPQDFTEEELRPAHPAHQQNQATSTAPPGMSPDSRYHVPPQYQQANGYGSTTPEPERPSPPRYQPAPVPSRYAERPAYQPSSTPGYDAPEPTTYAPRPVPSRRPYYPRRPTSSYRRPAYRQQYRRPQERPQYNANRRVTYYRAGTHQAYRRPSNRYAAPSRYETTTTQSSVPDYVPAPSYAQPSAHRHQYNQPQYASQNAYSSPSQYQTTTTEAPAPGERYYARVNNADQSKVAYAENPFDKMEFQSTPVPVGQKKDVKVTFINRQRMA
ncbi:hypothetical protein PMAYCL1PPCAC_19470 [Pristionchus mayeri]|uniref:Uncharacterized protein n=1 Tax=Pristionchus mayeri TaxID=1317129 RepID=A0AAN5I2N4_9BILA|nr:hypothetical protein PMAYCL1PPCAC_19470 [Pristionchus mayeri]